MLPTLKGGVGRLPWISSTSTVPASPGNGRIDLYFHPPGHGATDLHLHPRGHAGANQQHLSTMNTSAGWRGL